MIDASKNFKVVLVDDDIEMHDLVTAFLRPKGYQVICFSDPQSALQESIQVGIDWDVLLTDFHYPNMSIVDFTIHFKKLLPNLPIILITPNESADTALTAIQKGAYDFITKPIHFPQLLTAIERALHLNDLKVDLFSLREIVKAPKSYNGKIIGRSPKFLAALDIAKRVAASSANILITGESGSGKEVFAKYIHSESKFCKGPLVAINCSAIPENLLESELFGHAKGSFTGAQDKKIGLFEEAQDGTLFLDEIGDLSLSLQAKLLRVLQEKQIKRVGENQCRPINCRIISATHKDLAVEVAENRFREDLFFRLNVIPITIPPLRERKEDLLPLAETFLKKYTLENGSAARFFSKEAIQFILENPWRGNVRELENVVERAVVLSTGAEITLENFIPLSINLNHPCRKSNLEIESDENTFLFHYQNHLPTLDEVIHRYIAFAIQKNGGAKDRTAKEIGIDRKTLYKRLNQENFI